MSYATIFSPPASDHLPFPNSPHLPLPQSPVQLLFSSHIFSIPLSLCLPSSLSCSLSLSLSLSLSGWTGTEPTNTAIKRTPVWVWKHYQGLATLTLPLHTLTWIDVFVGARCVQPAIKTFNMQAANRWHLAHWTNSLEGYNSFCLCSTSKKQLCFFSRLWEGALLRKTPVLRQHQSMLRKKQGRFPYVDGKHQTQDRSSWHGKSRFGCSSLHTGQADRSYCSLSTERRQKQHLFNVPSKWQMQK